MEPDTDTTGVHTDAPRFMDLRGVISLENQALGKLDLDMDELAERPFVDPRTLDDN